MEKQKGLLLSATGLRTLVKTFIAANDFLAKRTKDARSFTGVAGFWQKINENVIRFSRGTYLLSYGFQKQKEGV